MARLSVAEVRRNLRRFLEQSLHCKDCQAALTETEAKAHRKQGHTVIASTGHDRTDMEAALYGMWLLANTVKTRERFGKYLSRDKIALAAWGGYLVGRSSRRLTPGRSGK